MEKFRKLFSRESPTNSGVKQQYLLPHEQKISFLFRKRCNVFCVVPALNEEKGIGWVINRIKKDLIHYKTHIIVIDGHSTDKTREIAQRFGAEILPEPGTKSQRGYGNALNAGFKYVIKSVSGNDENFLVMLDADGTYLPRDIPLLIDKLYDSHAGMVIGNRFANMTPGAMNIRNRLGNKIITFLLNLLYHTRINDSQSGMRVFRVEDIKKMRLMQNGMPFATELIMESKRRQIKICEVPISYKLRMGQPKLSPILDGAKIIISMVEHFTQHRPQRLYFSLVNLVKKIIIPFDQLLRYFVKG